MLIGNFSAGAASAIACKVGAVDRIVYAETGSEDSDNSRFVRECEERLFDVPVERVRSAKFRDTWTCGSASDSLAESTVHRARER